MTAVKNGEKAPVVTLQKSEDGISYIVKAAYTENMKLGTYQYDLIPELTNGEKLKKITLKVKVTESKKPVNANLKVQKGGSIDLVKRNSTGYTYQVSSSVQNTYIKDIALSRVMLGNQTIDTEVFETAVTKQDGQVREIHVRAKEGAELLAGKKYKLIFAVQPATDKCELASAETSVTITPKEGSLSLNVNMKSAVLNRNVAGMTLIYKVQPKDSNVKIAEIELVSDKTSTSGAFEVSENAFGNKEIKIADKTKVTKNKTYTLKFKVRAEGGKKYSVQSLKIKIQ